MNYYQFGIKYHRQVLIITLFNKCDIFRMDQGIINYVKFIFKSFIENET